MHPEQRNRIPLGEDGPTIEILSGPKKTVLLIPGQGTKIGNLGEEFVAHPAVQQIYRDAQGIFGFDVLTMTRNGSEEDKRNTLYAQPMLAAYYAGGLAMLKDKHPELFDKYPDYIAGQSFGFVVACYVAGFFKDHKDFFRFVKARAQGFDAADPGGMIYVGENPRKRDKNPKTKPVPEFRQTIRMLKPHITPLSDLEEAIINSGSIVYAGSYEAIAAAKILVDEDSSIIIRDVDTTGPFHHPRLMQKAVPYVEQALAEIEPGPIVASVILNTNGRITNDPWKIRKELIDQITNVARWYKTDAVIRREGGETIELGSDKGPLTKLATNVSARNVAIVALSGLVIGGVAFATRAVLQRRRQDKENK